MNADPFRRVPTRDEYKADLARETGHLSDEDIARIIRQSQPEASMAPLILWVGLCAATSIAIAAYLVGVIY